MALGRGSRDALKRSAIRTTGALLEAAKSPKGRKELAVKTGIDEKRLLKWANAADRMRIKGVGEDYAELDPRGRRRHRTRAQVPQCQAADRGDAQCQCQAQAGGLLPSEKAVERWIEHAKKLPLKISY